MKNSVWNIVASLSGIGAAIVTRKLTSALWKGDPPRNPADRSVQWSEGLAWAVASGVGAGVARLVGRRAASAGWEKAFGETPPGVAASAT